VSDPVYRFARCCSPNVASSTGNTARSLGRPARALTAMSRYAEIRAAVKDFEQRLAAKTPIEAGEIGRIGKLLHDHVRLEENEVFPRIEKTLGEEQLNAMGRGLTRLHSKHDVCEI
jgi:hypothetical protein